MNSDFMNSAQIEIIDKNLGLKLDKERVSRFKEWQKLFVEYNSHTNLMSKNEIANLFEKHVYDSLSIVLWKDFLKISAGGKLLDIGTGGGFPSVILAAAFTDLTVIANDSRSRKVKFIELAKNELGLKNLIPICGRAEEMPVQNADIITFRAVGKIKDMLPLAKNHAKNGSRIVFYKALGAENEANEALCAHKWAKSYDIVPYKLPIDIEHTRNLVVVGI